MALETKRATRIESILEMAGRPVDQPVSSSLSVLLLAIRLQDISICKRNYSLYCFISLFRSWLAKQVSALCSNRRASMGAGLAEKKLKKKEKKKS